MRMANKRFEMYQYRQILVRMRMGESNRAIAESGLMGREKAQKLRDIALEHDWINKLNPLPDNAQLATVLNVTVHTPSSSMSSVLPYAEKVNKWIESGVQGSTIHQKLVNSYGFTGSYWAVNRYIKSVIADPPSKVSTVMEFDPTNADSHSN